MIVAGKILGPQLSTGDQRSLSSVMSACPGNSPGAHLYIMKYDTCPMLPNVGPVTLNRRVVPRPPNPFLRLREPQFSFTEAAQGR